MGQILQRQGIGMKACQLFPSIMIALSIGAAAVYLPTGDWRRVLYWIAAAALTYSVTW